MNEQIAEPVDAEFMPAQPTELAQVQADPLAAMAVTLERLVTNPNVTPEKVQKFLDMQEHILDRQAQVQFNAAMVKAQGQMQTVLKNKQGERSPYADLEAVLAMSKPIYTNEGFAVTFSEGFGTTEHPLKDGYIRMVADIMHESGHTKIVTADVPLDDRGPQGQINKTGTQATGSSFSYGRRYLNCMIWNIGTGDDNDGARNKKAPEPLSKARKAQEARQQGGKPNQQPTPSPGPGSVPKMTAPPQQPADPQPPAQNGMSEADKQARVDFAAVCDFWALEGGIIQPGERLKPEQYRALAEQAKALSGSSDLCEAVNFMKDIKAMVSDSAGIRIIGK